MKRLVCRIVGHAWVPAGETDDPHFFGLWRHCDRCGADEMYEVHLHV